MPGIQIFANNECVANENLHDSRFDHIHRCHCINSCGGHSGHSEQNFKSRAILSTHKSVSYDVSYTLTHINSLSLPMINTSNLPHPPLGVCPPREVRGVPVTFGFDGRLIRSELHNQLLSYLARGVESTTFTTGIPAIRLQLAREVVPFDRTDGYRALHSLVYGSLLASLNTVLLDETARNACLEGRRVWSVASPLCSTAPSSGIELRVDGVPHVAVELFPKSVVPNDLMDAVQIALKKTVGYDPAFGRVISSANCQHHILHYDALSLLTQIWTRFANNRDGNLTWIVLTNLDRSIVFHRKVLEIKASHIIRGDGASTPPDCVQNLYSLLLALSTLERPQYARLPLIDLGI